MKIFLKCQTWVNAFALAGRKENIFIIFPRAMPWAMCLLGFQPVSLLINKSLPDSND